MVIATDVANHGRIAPDMLSALNPVLPLLAARAAIELDNLKLGRPSGLENVRLLAERLTNTTEAGSGSGRQFSADPATLDIIMRALSASPKEFKTVQDVAKAAWAIAEELHSATKDQDSSAASESSLSKLCTFCVELAKSASIYRQLLEEAQPNHAPWS